MNRTLLLFLVVASGCADESPRPATHDEVIAACQLYAVNACRSIGACLGHTPAQIAYCIDQEYGECDEELQAESCWTRQRDALEECSADVESESCEDVCNDIGFCFDPCPYFCPSE